MRYNLNRLFERPREIAIIGMVLAFAIFIPSFFEANNLRNLLAQSAPLLLLAIGQTFVLLVGAIDLTQGAIVGLSSVVLVHLCNIVGIPNAILITSIATFALGYLNGRFVALSRIDPFIVTLAGMYVIIGVTMYWTGGTPVTDLTAYTSSALQWIGTTSLSVVPTMFIIALGLCVAAHFFLARTAKGLHIFATGSNARAARALGIRTDRLYGIAFGLSSMFSGVAALVLTSRIQQGNPHLGEGLLFESIGGAVLGGVLLSGGVGSAWSAARGVAMLVLIQNGLYLTDLDSHVRDIAIGGLIIAGMLASRRTSVGGLA